MSLVSNFNIGWTDFSLGENDFMCDWEGLGGPDVARCGPRTACLTPLDKV